MARFDKLNWMTTEKKLIFVEDYLNKIKHHKLLTISMIGNLRKVTPLMKEAGKIWINKCKLQNKIKSEARE